MRYAILLTLFGFVSCAWGQLSPEEAKARMDAMNKAAATRPTTVAKPLAPPKLGKMVKRWVAKGDAPAIVGAFIDTFEDMRRYELYLLSLEKKKIDEEMARANAMTVRTRRVRSGPRIDTVDDESDRQAKSQAIARCNEKMQKLNAEVRRCRDPLYIPHPALGMERREGDYGYVGDKMVVITKNSFGSLAENRFDFIPYLELVEVEESAIFEPKKGDDTAERAIRRHTTGVEVERPTIRIPENGLDAVAATLAYTDAKVAAGMLAKGYKLKSKSVRADTGVQYVTEVWESSDAKVSGRTTITYRNGVVVGTQSDVTESVR